MVGARRPDGLTCSIGWSRAVLIESRCGLSSPRMTDLWPEQIITLVAPIVIIQLCLMIAALIDLERDERRVRGGSKLAWALVIVFVSTIRSSAACSATWTRILVSTRG